VIVLDRQTNIELASVFAAPVHTVEKRGSSRTLTTSATAESLDQKHDVSIAIDRVMAFAKNESCEAYLTGV
jgi:hypothetical protein